MTDKEYDIQKLKQLKRKRRIGQLDGNMYPYLEWLKRRYQ